MSLGIPFFIASQERNPTPLLDSKLAKATPSLAEPTGWRATFDRKMAWATHTITTIEGIEALSAIGKARKGEEVASLDPAEKLQRKEANTLKWFLEELKKRSKKSES